MFNTLTSSTVALECNRLIYDLTARGYKRFMGRLFAEQSKLELVFSLGVDAPKKSVFEKMAASAEKAVTTALEDAAYFSVMDKKRSPKNGTVVYELLATISTPAPHTQMQYTLRELRKLASASIDVEDVIVNLVG